VLYRQMLLPELEHTYHDLISAAEDADLLIAGELVYAAPLVAEKSRVAVGIPYPVPVLIFLLHRSFIDRKPARSLSSSQGGPCGLQRPPSV